MSHGENVNLIPFMALGQVELVGGVWLAIVRQVAERDLENGSNL